MSIILDTSSIQTLVSPTGKTTSIVPAIFARQYNAGLVLLYELRNQLQQESPQLVQASGFARAIDLMKTYPAASQKAILHYPTFRFWLDVAIELVRRRSHLLFPKMHVLQHLQGFWRYVLAAALHAQEEMSCSLLTDADGRIALPGLDIYFQTRAPSAYQHLNVRICDGELVAYNHNDTDKAEVPLFQQSIVSLDGRFQLNDVDSDLRLAGRTSLDYDKLKQDTVREWDDILTKAWTWISRASPLIAEEIPLGIQVLVPVRSSSPLIHLSASFREAPGLVTMSWSADAYVIAEALVHEYHHQKLNALLDIDPIIMGPTTLPLYYSPWRKDPRPLSGLLHAVYTFQGILEFCNSLLIADIPQVDEFRIQKRIYEISQQVRTGLSSLLENADLSPLGKALVQAISQNLETQLRQAPNIETEIQQGINRNLAIHQRDWNDQYGHLLQRQTDLRQKNLQIVYLKSALDSAIGLTEQEVLDILGLPQSYDASEFTEQQSQSDSVLNAVRALAHDRGINSVSTLLTKIIPGNSLLLDLFAGHSYYMANNYVYAAKHYEACIQQNPEISYFWQYYAFALRHLGQWDKSLLILTNLDALIENSAADRTATKDDSAVEKRLARILKNTPAIFPPEFTDLKDSTHRPPPSRESKLSLASFFRNNKIESFFEFAPAGTQLPAFLSVIYGLKPAMDIWIPRYGWPAFQELANHLGLHYHLDTYFDRYAESVTSLPYDQLTTTRAAFCRSFESRADAHVFIARTQEQLHTVVANGWYPLVVNKRIVHKHLADHDKFGKSLGYPDCCQEFFRLRNNWFYDNTYYAAYENTTGNPSLYANGFMRHTAFGLIHHMACSFRCEATIATATKLHDLITSEYPEYGKEIERQLKSPILCLSELRIYQFVGELDSSTQVHYDEVEIVHPTQANDDIYRLLKLGDSCSIDGNLLRIYRNGQQIATYFARADHHGPELPFLLQCS